MQSCNFTKINSIVDVFLRIFKHLQSVIFRSIFNCGKELNYLKFYIEGRRGTTGDDAPIFEYVFFEGIPFSAMLPSLAC